jgi:hypothetical protein
MLDATGGNYFDDPHRRSAARQKYSVSRDNLRKSIDEQANLESSKVKACSYTEQRLNKQREIMGGNLVAMKEQGQETKSFC